MIWTLFKCYHCKEPAQAGITRHCIFCGFDVHTICKPCPIRKYVGGK